MLSIKSAEAAEISGRVLLPDNTPADAVQVIVADARKKTFTEEDGTFTLDGIEPGTYTATIRAPGYQIKTQKLTVPANNIVIVLEPLRVRGSTFVVKGDRDIQSISRNTLNKDELKNAPATFGDSINALTTLPGVIRTGGFLGPLIIRGAAESSNRYFIDDIPILNPQHFGAIQSIINNETIGQIDLFSSAFPARYGSATGAIIDIRTLDEVKTDQNVINVSFISADFFTAHPIGGPPQQIGLYLPPASAIGAAAAAPLAGKATENKIETAPSINQQGYWLASGRISYLTAIIPVITKAIDAGPEQLPEYYDYQLKGKYYLDNLGRHSLTGLFFGSYDTFIFLNDDITAEEEAERRKEGADPLGDKFGLNNEVNSHAQGLYYSYRPSSKFENKVTAYGSLNFITFKTDAISAREAGLDRDINIDNTPHVFGLKNSVYWNLKPGFYSLRTAIGLEEYVFSADGKAQQLTRQNVAGGQPDLGDNSLFRSVPINYTETNTLLYAYLENQFEFWNFEFVPGARIDYLTLTEDATVDPRAMLAYNFPTDTKVSVAGGIYHSFPQTNFFLFNQPFNQQPQVTTGKNILPERSVHRSVAIEQGFDLYTVKVEGFRNDFDQVLESEPFPSLNSFFSSSGEIQAQGFELLFRKDRLGGIDGIYGWISYTFTDSKFKPASLTDPNRGELLNFQYEQPHSVKLILGYIFGVNEIGIRFELNSGFPYTPVVGSQELIPGRYSQVYGQPFSERYPASHRLDFRYTRTSTFGWGKLVWYVEVINTYNFRADSSQSWKFNKPYKAGSNPELAPGGGFGIIPNFGLEFRF